MWRWLVYITRYWVGIEGAPARRIAEIVLLIVSLAALLTFALGGNAVVRSLALFVGVALLLVLPAIRFKRLEDVIRPVLKIECGEKIPNSIRRAQKIPLVSVDPQSGQSTESKMVPADLFGFNLTNQGTSPVHNCEALLVRISSRHRVLYRKPIRLPNERSNHGKDQERFVLWHNKPQVITLCAITGDNHIILGSGNVSPPHASAEIIFDEIGEYFFDAQISGMVDARGIQTIERRFTLRWGGDGPSSSIAGPSHVPPNT